MALKIRGFLSLEQANGSSICLLANSRLQSSVKKCSWVQKVGDSAHIVISETKHYYLLIWWFIWITEMEREQEVSRWEPSNLCRSQPAEMHSIDCTWLLVFFSRPTALSVDPAAAGKGRGSQELQTHSLQWEWFLVPLCPFLCRSWTCGSGWFAQKVSSMSQGHCSREWITSLSQGWKLGPSLRDWCHQTRSPHSLWMILLVPSLTSPLPFLPLWPTTTVY